MAVNKSRFQTKIVIGAATKQTCIKLGKEWKKP